MKHVNLVGGTLAAVLASGVLAACDGRGVTAMKSRGFTAEEQALAKAMEGKSQSTPAKSTPSATPVKSEIPAAGENEPVENTGSAQGKLFEEKGGVVVAKRSEILLKAEEQLGVPNPDARLVINGLSIWNKSAGAAWRINVEAVIVMNGIEKNMFLNDIEVSATQTDVVGGLSGVELKDRLASNVVATVNADKLVVSTICQTIKDEQCTKAILVIQRNVHGGGAQFVLVQFDRNQNGKVTGLTNVGELPSFQEANDKAAELPAKPTATLADIERVANEPKPAAPFVKTKTDLAATSIGSRTNRTQSKFEFRPAPSAAPKPGPIKETFAQFAARRKLEKAAAPAASTPAPNLRYQRRTAPVVKPTSAVVPTTLETSAPGLASVAPATAPKPAAPAAAVGTKAPTGYWQNFSRYIGLGL